MSEPESDQEMPNFARGPAAHLTRRLNAIRDRVAAQAKGRSVRLVAVSKLHSAEDILTLHQGPACHNHFGENYVKELVTKADMLPRTIQWHFIGGLQTGHCKKLAKIPNLFCVSSVDTIKKAERLNINRGNNALGGQPLFVHVQVNTSGESTKSGCQDVSETIGLCNFIIKNCSNLCLKGFMTIGAPAESKDTNPDGLHRDFAVLQVWRESVANVLSLPPESLELSIGMSDDFESAIVMGSDEVRVGTLIFGPRPAFRPGVDSDSV